MAGSIQLQTPTPRGVANEAGQLAPALMLQQNHHVSWLNHRFLWPVPIPQLRKPPISLHHWYLLLRYSHIILYIYWIYIYILNIYIYWIYIYILDVYIPHQYSTTLPLKKISTFYAVGPQRWPSSPQEPPAGWCSAPWSWWWWCPAQGAKAPRCFKNNGDDGRITWDDWRILGKILLLIQFIRLHFSLGSWVYMIYMPGMIHFVTRKCLV